MEGAETSFSGLSVRGRAACNQSKMDDVGTRLPGNRPPFPCFLSPRSARCSPCPTTGEKGGADVEEIGSCAGIQARILEGGRCSSRGRGVAERWRDAVEVRGALWG